MFNKQLHGEQQSSSSSLRLTVICVFAAAQIMCVPAMAVDNVGKQSTEDPPNTLMNATAADTNNGVAKQGSVSVSESSNPDTLITQPQRAFTPAIETSSPQAKPIEAPPVPPAVQPSAKLSPTSAPNEPTVPDRNSVAGRSAQLLKIQSCFEDGNFRQARKLANEFVASHPLDHNGYFALGQIDIQEKQLAPELDQWALMQFLKAAYLSPGNKKLQNVWAYLAFPTHAELARKQGILPVNGGREGPDALLNFGVNLFRTGSERDAIDVFTFVSKYVPLGATSAHYNLGAIDESHGRLEAAKKEYLASMHALQYRSVLLNGLETMRERLQNIDRSQTQTSRRGERAVINDIGQSRNSGANIGQYSQSVTADGIAERLVARAIQRIDVKIHAHDRTWTGYTPQKDARPTDRCVINRFGTDDTSDLIDAGLITQQRPH
jgi:hypothetical protein